MAKLALLGATGSLGRLMGHLLSAADHPYRAVSRSDLGLRVRFGDRVAEPVMWDPEQPASVFHALEDIETAVYLVGMPLWEFGKHLPLTRRVIQAAIKAKVRRLLLVSSSWAYGIPQSTPTNESHPLAALTAKGLVRADQELAVLTAHTEGLMETAVLRMGDLYGPYVEQSYLWSAFKAAKNGTHAQLMSPADAAHEFVYVPDAARTILQMIEEPAIWGRAWNLGGVGVSTLRAMTKAIFAAAGRDPNYETPPPWKMRVVAAMNPYVREMREMQYLLETPVILDDSALSGALGGLKKTPYAEGIRDTLLTVRMGR
jgi:nucleoside-diphosphate-sugar epimerase